MNSSVIISHAAESERAEFYKKTYTHVAMAILAFIVVESLLLKVVPEELILKMLGGRFIWLGILGLFWLGSYVSEKWTLSQSRSVQYAGLGFYVLLEAVIFLPLIYIAASYSGIEIIQQAGMITLALFAGLTAVVFMTNKDFSFLRTAIVVGGFIALGLIVAGAIFGFNLGLWFSVGMVILASASILYQTSKLKDTYSTDQYVGASLLLFSSVMLLFWYILRILMSRRG
ncbi:Bax inhibitor-1/YccA family protein [Kaistella sp. G5-32]|uniref:Bax inhibitor-1/YccA family protein n=1 Tax=Kaistella gelatinilytica TaxID=2787636 RepID=A0ABS0F8U2_9FLAO|nr:Bax inhibitor-1 family protein [Kaistella gelatinilytica]MBF8456126.1 Bax inhibitor-1/YccA family protein [Kaistella gelatinilytica]